MISPTRILGLGYVRTGPINGLGPFNGFGISAERLLAPLQATWRNRCRQRKRPSCRCERARDAFAVRARSERMPCVLCMYSERGLRACSACTFTRGRIEKVLRKLRK
eukprot:2772332-Pleurochrysis_carterae.AAC.3